ncbi:SCO2522 family protein [Rugosimonospora acidiphila]|uniref:SCO2522 family protein n=2 Tax=Rugosimonospora acidiphila TaxID=556531 RepID=A0ABP9SFC2_9ACTN
MAVDATFREASAQPRVEQLPLSHVSIELGHLYMEDYAAGIDGLRANFQRVAPWVEAARRACQQSIGDRRSRISTCFLVDDYFGPFGSPRLIVPDLIRAAADAGLEIDYLGRESGCASADGVPVAQLVEDQLVVEPAPTTDGSRPPATEVGWLSNGQRSPVPGQGGAMGVISQWKPPVENAANRHSIFVDVELWDEKYDSARTWSCPFLASVWQLLRLGMLRNLGEGVAVPQPRPDELPERWDELPALLKLNPSAAPFSAYRTFSVLANRFLPVEHAVRTILGQVNVTGVVAAQVAERADREGVTLPPELVERIEYAFVYSGSSQHWH